MLIQDMKVAPHYFVGLGGCGSKIVNEIARKVKRRKDEYERYRNLLHFFAVDTDMAELQRCETVDAWIPISNFDKPQYVKHAFGMLGNPEDPYFTQWWPDFYQPRKTTGAGAGQIRIESRLSLFYTLKNHPQYTQTMMNAIRASFDVGERFRDDNKAPTIHVYCSLAGGTGSGSFLMMAYFLKSLVARHRRPLVVGSFVLPGVFAAMGVPYNQLQKIQANGYAALQELEYLQSAGEEEGRQVPFHWDPHGTEDTLVTERPFDQVYLIDDIGALHGVIADAKQIYPHIADSAYTQIFSEDPEKSQTIVERDQSTLDNDERELGVQDVQHYTKRYGSFGVSIMTVPDDDILQYCSNRYAIEALNLAFALPESDDVEIKTSADRDKRDRIFVADIQSRARMQGEAGRMFQSILDWSDGSAGGSGAVDTYLRTLDELLEQLHKPMGNLPDIKEDWLLGMSGDQESVRVEVRRRYDNRKKKLTEAKETIDQIATNLAKEVLDEAYDHSVAKVLKTAGPIHERLFYLRLVEKLQERQKAAEETFRAAESSLQGIDDSFAKYHDELVSTAPIGLVEKVTGNKDYEQDAVPKFVRWFRDSVKKHQEASLINDGLLDFYDDLLDALVERLDRTATLFDELLAIRSKLEDKSEDLLKYGVPREFGGETTEHVLDVEVFQDFLDPEHSRLWNWLFGAMEQAADYNPEEISQLIQRAQNEARRRRHIPDKVIEALVGHGKEIWEERIRGKDKPDDRDELGLNIIDGLEQEARWALAWEELKHKYNDKRPNRLPSDEFEVIVEDMSKDRIESYINAKVAHAAQKCQPFLQFDPAGKVIPPKKYVCLYKGYREDDTFKRRLTNIQGFAIKEGDMMITGDPKRVVFYWNEVGVPIYKVYSVDQYGASYETVKNSELGRGESYDKRAVYTSARPDVILQRKKYGSKKCPDIPLHTDRNWEGAFDPYLLGVFPITQRAILENRARLHWEQERAKALAASQGTSGDVRLFTLALWAKAIDRIEQQYVFTNDHLNESDRALGKWRDTAFRNFGKAKTVIREWVTDKVEEALIQLKANRDWSPLGEYRRNLKDARVGMEDNEVELVRQELDALEAEINALKG
ncbi:MAG: hypothetical protein J7M25_15655 [Deltaproteobacteria bacterium]|nr:hypothetical protein [Deltaproteobacteria bacterium]